MTDQIPFDTRSFPESSFFLVAANGDLVLHLSAALFPSEGGAQCGNSSTQFNFSAHIREIIRQEIAAELIRK